MHILIECYYLKGELGESLDCINKVLNMVYDYYPAIIFKKIILDKIKIKKGEV